jgi:PEP-CTERM motif
MNSLRPSSRLLCATLAFSFVLGSMSHQLFAGPITADELPTITIKIEDSPNAPVWSHKSSANEYRPATDENGGYELATTKDFDILNNRAHVRIDELQFDPDPFVLNNILVTNTSNVTQLFTAFVGLPTTFPAPNIISGSVRTSVIDGGLDGATVATSGQPLYQAQIDGATVATLQNHPFTLNAGVGASNTAAATFGPIPNNVPVNSNIGIQLRFTLTPGDTAAILSRFDVVAIPEPASVALIGLGLTLISGVAGRVRRRQGAPKV